MPPVKNQRLLRALAREPVDATPIWIMRQAGRYLPEYRRLRQQAGSFLRLCQTPEFACEATLQPITRYALDAAILFSDILMLPCALGLPLTFIEGQGPHFAKRITSQQDITRLAPFDPTALQYVYATIQQVQHELDRKLPLIGFCGSPWTLAAYMVEGQASQHFPHLQAWRNNCPTLLHALLERLTSAVTQHLALQIEHGIDVAMLFDTWSSLLPTPADYERCSLYYIKQIIAQLAGRVPIILFTKNSSTFLTQLADSGAQALGIDWTLSLQTARAQVGHRVAVQGNLPPACLLTDPATIRQAVATQLADFGQAPGHIFNLGHGITPDVPPEHVEVLVTAVHELSTAYHATSLFHE